MPYINKYVNMKITNLTLGIEPETSVCEARAVVLRHDREFIHSLLSLCPPRGNSGKAMQIEFYSNEYTLAIYS